MQQYYYDANGRLAGVTGDTNASYTYDARGNITEIRCGDEVSQFEYDRANQLLSRRDSEGLHTFGYDRAGRLTEELLNGQVVARYTYGYLDKVTAVERNGQVTKFRYNGVGMLVEKEYPDGRLETWSWLGLSLLARGDERYINEPHASGGVPIMSLTSKGVRYHTSDYLGTTLCSMDAQGNVTDRYEDATPYGQGESLKNDPAARFTGKPYDKDLGAFVFPYRNYDPENVRWRSVDPSGFPDGPNAHFYAPNPTEGMDPLGLAWDNWDFVYHYYFGGGSAVSLSQAELLDSVQKVADGSEGGCLRFAAQIEKTAQEKAPAIGSFSDSFRNVYPFGDACWAIGDATLAGSYSGTLSIKEAAATPNGSARYSYTGVATITFYDEFSDPLSIISFARQNNMTLPSWLGTALNLGGTPFDIVGAWTKSYPGEFEK